MTALPTSEVLDLSADEIQRRGWATVKDSVDAWGVDGGPVCLEGAIFAVVGMPMLMEREHEYIVAACPAYAAVSDYLSAIEPRIERPYVFNDTFAETAEDVIAVLRSAAAVERLKEQSYDTEDQPLPFDEKAAA